MKIISSGKIIPMKINISSCFTIETFTLDIWKNNGYIFSHLECFQEYPAQTSA